MFGDEPRELSEREEQALRALARQASAQLQLRMRNAGLQELAVKDPLTGLATAVMGDPARAVAWLANKLAEYDEYLMAGSVVLSGSFISSVPVAAGDLVEADFGELGRVSCRFV